MKKNDDIKCEDFLNLTPKMWMLLAIVTAICEDLDLEVVVSSMQSDRKEDTKKLAVSTTHADGRAIDISVKGWALEQIGQVVRLIMENEIAMQIGAISASDGITRPVVYHDVGKSAHLHLQVNR